MTVDKALIADLRDVIDYYERGWVADVARAAADALEAAAARESNLTVNYETAQANWDLTLDRAEAAEAHIARLEAVAEAAKIVDKLYTDCGGDTGSSMDDLHAALAALEGEAK